MVKIIHLADDGTEVVAIEVDDFTIEILYSGIAEMLRAADTSTVSPVESADTLPPEARQGRDRILTRIRD